MRSILLIVLASLALPSCNRRFTPQQEAVEEQALRARVTAWARHMNNQNLDSLGSFYDNTPGLISMWPNGNRSVGWESERVALRDLFRDVATLNMVVQDPSVRVLEWGAAVVTFRYSMDRLLEVAARDVFSGYAMQVWIRDRESPAWRMLVTQMSRAPVGPTARALRP